MNYTLPSLNFEIPYLENISLESMASLAFFLVVGFVGIISIIMFYHWRKYGFSTKSFLITQIIYLSVVVVLISTAFLGLK